MNSRGVLLLATLSLSNCSNGNTIENINAFLARKPNNDVLQLSKKLVPINIVIDAHTELKYKRNPFVAFVPVNNPSITNNLKLLSIHHPDINHIKENLENYPLNTLKVIGTLLYQTELWALIKTSDNMIYRVKKNDYIGTNNGKILLVTLKQITIQELFQDQSGAWHPQQTSMTLNE